MGGEENASYEQPQQHEKRKGRFFSSALYGCNDDASISLRRLPGDDVDDDDDGNKVDLVDGSAPALKWMAVSG